MDLIRLLMSTLVDLAPAFAWKSGNLRWVGSHTVHFCYGHEGRRTVEIDSREVIVGRRRMLPTDVTDDEEWPIDELWSLIALVRVHEEIGWSHSDAIVQTLEISPLSPEAQGRIATEEATRQTADDMDLDDDALLQEIRVRWFATPADDWIPRPRTDWNDSGIRYPGGGTDPSDQGPS